MLNLTLILAAPGLSAVPPIAGADLLDAVPGSAVLVFSARDLDGLRERSSENAWSKFLADPEIAAIGTFLEEQGASWDKWMEEAEMPFDPLVFCGSIHDSMVAFVSPVGADNEPGFGFLFAPGDDRAAFEDQFDGLLELLENELTGSSEAHADVELMLFEHPAESNDPDLVAFEVGGVAALIGAEGAEVALELAQSVVDRLTGQDDSDGTGASASLAAARSSAGGAQSLEVFVDIASIFEFAASEADEEEIAMFELIGLTEMRWLYANADVGTGEAFDFALSVHVPAESYIATYIDLFGPLPLELGDFLPPEASSIGLFNYDVFGAWSATLDILQENAPAEYDELQAGLDMMSASSGLDVEQDLLAQISGTFASFAITVPEDEMAMSMGGLASTFGIELEGFDQGQATIIGLEDPEVVELFLEDLLSMAQVYAMVEQEEFQGELVNSIVMPGAMGIHWSFTDDALIISEYPTALHAALRKPGHGDSQSALEVGRFRDRMRGQAGSSALQVADTGQSMRMLLAAGGMMKEIFGSMGEFPAEAADLPMPNPDIATKYFSGTVLSSMKRANDSLVLTLSGR